MSSYRPDRVFDDDEHADHTNVIQQQSQQQSQHSDEQQQTNNDQQQQTTIHAFNVEEASPTDATHTDHASSSFSTSAHSSAPSSSSASATAIRDELNVALELIGYGRFQQFYLLPVTGLTLTADAMELMLLPFLTLGVECEWSNKASSSSSSSSASSDTSISDVETSFLSTVVFIGMLVGALLSGLSSDHIGRRPTVLLSTLCTALFGLLSAFVPNYQLLLICRCLVGVGVGASPAALALFTEFLPKAKRGEYLIHYLCFFSAGAVFEVAVAWLVLNTYGWRVLLLVSAIPAIVLIVLVACYLPESSSWLLSKGDRVRASYILQKVFVMNHSNDIQHVSNCKCERNVMLKVEAEEEEKRQGQWMRVEQEEEEEEIIEGGGLDDLQQQQQQEQSDQLSSSLDSSSASSSHLHSSHLPPPLIPCYCSPITRTALSHLNQHLLQLLPPPTNNSESLHHNSSSNTPSSTDSASSSQASFPILKSSNSSSSSSISPESSSSSATSSTSNSSSCSSEFFSFFAPIYSVFSPALRCMSCCLCILFLLMAFVYYGLVLMSLNFVQDETQHSQRSCTLRNDQYFQLLMANIAEFPGLFLCFVLLDRVGRRWTISSMFVATAIFMTLIPTMWYINPCANIHLNNNNNNNQQTEQIIVNNQDSVTPSVDDSDAAAVVLSPSPASSSSSSSSSPVCSLPAFDFLQSALLFGARACALAFNQALWVSDIQLNTSHNTHFLSSCSLLCYLVLFILLG